MITDLIVRSRILFCVGLAVGFTRIVWAGSGDSVFVCSTHGNDTYADGTAVADGECYALVHTVNGASFQGFTAEGKALDAEKSYVALTAALAKGGRCPPTLFQILEANAASRTNGVWELFLLDTRTADGKPSGVDGDGRLRRVNAWRRVRGRVRAKRGTVTSAGSFEEVVADTSSARLDGGASALPTGTPQPRISGIKVVNGVVELTVADTVPYLTYDVEGAETPGDLHRRARRMARQPRDGRAGGEVKLEVKPEESSAGGRARFFKVVRK